MSLEGMQSELWLSQVPKNDRGVFRSGQKSMLTERVKIQGEQLVGMRIFHTDNFATGIEVEANDHQTTSNMICLPKLLLAANRGAYGT